MNQIQQQNLSLHGVSVGMCVLRPSLWLGNGGAGGGGWGKGGRTGGHCSSIIANRDLTACPTVHCNKIPVFKLPTFQDP